MTGKEVPYGKHVPWLFEINHPEITKKLFDISRFIEKVELPILDYSSNKKDVKVIVHFKEIVES